MKFTKILFSFYPSIAMPNAINPNLDVIYLRVVFETEYKTIKITEEQKTYMNIALAAGKFYKQLEPYYNKVVKTKGFDNETLINSIRDIVQNEHRFSEQIEKCYAIK